MRGLAQATVIGNLTADPDLRHTQNETSVCNLSLAVNHAKDKVSFLNVTAFGKTAELANQYLSKGSGVAIAGELQQDRWEDKQGNERSKVKVIANQITFLGGGSSGSDNGKSEADSDDIPF